LLRSSLVSKQGADERLSLLAPFRAFAERYFEALPEERRYARLSALCQALQSALANPHEQLEHGGARRRIGVALKEEANLAKLIAQAKILPSFGKLYICTARVERAGQSCEQDVLLYRDLDNRLGQADAVGGRGKLPLARAFPAVASDFFLQALEL